jgi:hypothetical protein
MICTQTGVPRKNQMYTQAIHESTGSSDSRMIARIVPPTAPPSMATKVTRR